MTFGLTTTHLMTVDELDCPDLEVERVLPRDALVLDRRPVHQLIGSPLQRDPADGNRTRAAENGRRVEREVPRHRGCDVLRQHHHIVLAWKGQKVRLQ